jgi:DNA-binding response OmpR family regulator
MGRILVIEDEQRIASFIGGALKARGWAVDLVAEGRTALKLVETRDYDLVLMDLVMPGLHGVELLQRLLQVRPHQRTMVLSGRAEPRLKVECLEAGAVDYVTKPFSLDELIARVNVRSKAEDVMDTYVYRGGVKLDIMKRRAEGLKGEVDLTEREFLLLRHLMSNAGAVCSRPELLSEVWGFSFDPGSNVVDVYVRRLRSKLGDIIRTVRNVGYTLAG